MPETVSPVEVVFLGLILGGLAFQSRLYKRAGKDVRYFAGELRDFGQHMADPVRQFFVDALISSRLHRDQAVVHMGIKAAGLLLAVWALFTPDPIRPELKVFGAAGGLYVLAVFTALDFLAYRDYRSRRHQEKIAKQEHGEKAGGESIPAQDGG